MLTSIIPSNGFPYHIIPDGSVLYPHHFWIGGLVILAICWFVSDDWRHVEPKTVVAGTFTSLFAFGTLWGTAYPVTGAVGTLVGLTIASIAVLVRKVWSGWREGRTYPLWARVSVYVGLYVAWDDALEHAFGWPMPLDIIWNVSNAAQWLPQIA